MPSKPIPDRFLSFAEVAELLGVDVHTVKKGRCQTNEIPRIKLGGRVVFSFNAVQAWMAAKAEEAEQSRLRSRMAMHDVMATKSERREAIQRTLLTIINGGRYK